MRELALLVFDVVTALLLFIVGSGSISLLGLRSLAPIGLLPFALWLKLRVPLRDWTCCEIVAWCVGFTLYFFAWEHSNPFDKSDWRDLLQFPVLFLVVAVVHRIMGSSRQPTSHAQDGANQ